MLEKLAKKEVPVQSYTIGGPTLFSDTRMADFVHPELAPVPAAHGPVETAESRNAAKRLPFFQQSLRSSQRRAVIEISDSPPKKMHTPDIDREVLLAVKLEQGVEDEMASGRSMSSNPLAAAVGALVTDACEGSLSTALAMAITDEMESLNGLGMDNDE